MYWKDKNLEKSSSCQPCITLTGIVLICFTVGTVNLPVTVLDTDYTSYALLYGCHNTGSGKSRQYAFVMTRPSNFPPPQNQLNGYYDTIEDKTGRSQSDFITKKTDSC